MIITHHGPSLAVPGDNIQYFLFDGEALYAVLQFSLSTTGSVCQMNSCPRTNFGNKFAFLKETGLVGHANCLYMLMSDYAQPFKSGYITMLLISINMCPQVNNVKNACRNEQYQITSLSL